MLGNADDVWINVLRSTVLGVFDLEAHLIVSSTFSSSQQSYLLFSRARNSFAKNQIDSILVGYRIV